MVRVVAGVAAVLWLALGAPVVGHAQLGSADPGPGDVVTVSPPTLVARFTQNLGTTGSKIDVLDADGALIASGGRDPDQRRVMRVALPPLDAGTFTVEWTSLSSQDGETATGSYRFTVLAPSPSPSDSPVPTSPPATAPPPSPSASPAPTAPPTASPTATSSPTAATTSTMTPSPSATSASSGAGGPDQGTGTPATLLVAALVAGFVLGALAWASRHRRRP